MPILGILASRDGGTPTAPTIGTATAGDASATVAYTASTYTGKGAATYLATSSPGSLTGTGASPITVSGLTNGTAYTFTVKATSTTGETATSAASNSVTPATASSFESIATITAAGGETSLSFTSIPSTYKSLQMRWIAKDSQTTINGAGPVYVTFNSDTASNYVYHQLNGNGTAAAATWSGGASGSIGLRNALNRSYTGYTNIFGTGIMDIQDYTSTSKYKTTRTLTGVDANNAGQGGGFDFGVGLQSGIWMSTAAITTIKVEPGTCFVAGTTFALYGIKG